MRKILLVLVAAALPANTRAEPLVHQKPGTAAPGKLLAPKAAPLANTCAAYGAGFVRIEGTDTCVKIGGGVSIGAGASTGWR